MHALHPTTAGNIQTNALPTRPMIIRLQDEMRRFACAQPDPEHIFHDGWYERRLLIPAGMLIVGKIHRHAHPVGVLRGRAIVVSEFGRDVVEAGYYAVSPPGVKRVVMAIDETLFFTLHRNPSNTRDLRRIELEHIEPESIGLDVKEALQ